ncbi:MAG: O-antigen ligase family protein [Phycisphaerales bacterium]|nr:O-antigen ligase family protein [Phycisphaerales bacterium]
MALALSAGGWSRATRLAVVAAAVVSAWALMATVSRGAIGAAALGALVVGVGWAQWRPWVGRAVLGAAVCVVLAVMARGVVGERLGERSLLFRAQYMQGTAAVWAEHPVAGVGPGRFQDAYTRLKPERAPEEVTSPHSLAFDWVGVLGLGGVAWVGLVASGFGRRASRDEAVPDDGAVGTRVLVRMAMGVVGAAVLMAAYSGRAAVVPETALALLIGGFGWAVAAGLACAKGGERGVRVGALGAGAVALIHGQLDVTPVWVVSAPAWGVLIGLGIGAVGLGGGDRIGRWAAGLGLVAVAAALGWRAGGVARWEAGLDRAAAWPRMISQARLELAVAERRGDAQGVAAVGQRVGDWLGAGVRAEPRAVADAIEGAVLGSQESAAAGLREAVAARPGHVGTRSALARVLVTIAMRDLDRAPERARAAWLEAVSLMEEAVALRPGEPSAWSGLGGVLERGTVVDGDRGAVWLGRAVEVWTEGDRLTPHSPAAAARIAEGLARLGRADEAAVWAARAIGRDDALELEPRRRLSPGRRAGVEAIARGGAGSGTESDTGSGVGSP